MGSRIYLALCLPTILSLGAIAQTAPESEVPTFRAGTSLVLVDVLAVDEKTGLPVQDLTKADFRLKDNRKAVEVTTFDSGAHYSTRAVALWLVVICNEKGERELRSGSFTGKEALFRPALNSLDKHDMVGVAHWCDDGTAAIDLTPTKDADAAIAMLGEALKPIDFDPPPSGQFRPGELACQKMLHLILEDARKANPQPLPVIVFLHADHTGMPYRESDELADNILETSGIVFGIMDHSLPLGPRSFGNSGERGAIFHYLTEETGGQYYMPTPELYSTALEAILVQLHFRYELGFKPPALDGKRHELGVELVGAAKDKYKSVRLRARPEYIPKARK